jgi:hypothetical protein
MICCSFKDRNNNEDDSNQKKEVEEYFQSINLSAKKLSSEKKETLDGELHNITYLEYLLRYLAVEFEKGKNWIADFYKELNNHNYSSEEHWCHLFQWSEFEIKYKPFCLNINGDYKFYPQSDYFKYKITKEINSEDNTIQYKIYKEKIYVLVEIIKDHLLDNNHPINFILNSFRNHFSNYLQQNIIELNSLKKNNLNNDEETKRNIISICKGIIEELQNFIIQTTNILGIMYKNVNNSQIFFDESDEFNNLITGILFSNNKDEKDDLYTLMLELINIMIYDQSKKFGQILLEKKNISPEEVGIQEKFCLNKVSLDYYSKTFKKDININQIIPSIPYEETISLLKKISFFHKPYDKLILTNRLSQNISKNVTNFWNLIDKTLPMKDFGIEADDFLKLFPYLIYRAQITNLIVELKFIEFFTSSKTRSSMFGYYFSQLLFCAEQIVEENNKE